MMSIIRSSFQVCMHISDQGKPRGAEVLFVTAAFWSRCGPLCGPSAEPLADEILCRLPGGIGRYELSLAGFGQPERAHASVVGGVAFHPAPPLEDGCAARERRAFDAEAICYPIDPRPAAQREQRHPPNLPASQAVG